MTIAEASTEVVDVDSGHCSAFLLL